VQICIEELKILLFSTTNQQISSDWRFFILSPDKDQEKLKMQISLKITNGALSFVFLFIL
jgi:hypothetical protein